jgi:hypothetical protein
MSIIRKRGVVIGHAETAVYDHFVGANILELQLMREDGKVEFVRILADRGLLLASDIWCKLTTQTDKREMLPSQILSIDPEARHNLGRSKNDDPYGRVADLPERKRLWFLEVFFAVAVGDTIEVTWDYQRQGGEILAFGENRMVISRDLPVTRERSFHAGDILDCFCPTTSWDITQ